MMKIAVIDYGSGNINSVSKAFAKVAKYLDPKAELKVTNQAKDVLNATHVILPGVGAFYDCANQLRKQDGLWHSLNEAIIKQGKAFFGICVGQQMMVEKGLEIQETEGLAWLSGVVRKIKPADPSLKIPHMGWNHLNIQHEHPVLKGCEDLDVYFTHSWAVCDIEEKHILAHCDYGGKLVAAIGKDNMFGSQFHPEKSQKTGLKIIENFLKWSL